MNWTREKPTQPGWWWLKLEGAGYSAHLVEVPAEALDGSADFHALGQSDQIYDDRCEWHRCLWAGPLVPPGEGE